MYPSSEGRGARGGGSGGGCLSGMRLLERCSGGFGGGSFTPVIVGYFPELDEEEPPPSEVGGAVSTPQVARILSVAAQPFAQFAAVVTAPHLQVLAGQSQVISTVLPLHEYSSVVEQAPPDELEPLRLTKVQDAPESVGPASWVASLPASLPPELPASAKAASFPGEAPLSSLGVIPELELELDVVVQARPTSVASRGEAKKKARRSVMGRQRSARRSRGEDGSPPGSDGNHFIGPRPRLFEYLRASEGRKSEARNVLSCPTCTTSVPFARSASRSRWLAQQRAFRVVPPKRVKGTGKLYLQKTISARAMRHSRISSK